MAVKTYRQVALQMLAIGVAYVVILLLTGEFRWGTSAMIIFSLNWIAWTSWEFYKVRRDSTRVLPE